MFSRTSPEVTRGVRMFSRTSPELRGELGCFVEN